LYTDDFPATVGRTVHDSVQGWQHPPRPPDGAPSVVVIVLDDVGFAQLGCYGSRIDTPNIDRLAERGLRYNNFHTTALCSPTRAALLTGRNPHAVGVGSVVELPIGFPGHDGVMPRSAATIARILRDRGWNTWCLGKWHLTPEWERTPVGPYDRWPLGMGFERFYGFLGGETDQYAPSLVHDNHRIDPPGPAGGGYHLSEDLVDQAIRMLREQRSVDPTRPFLTYLSFGACHAPHQAPRAFIDRYRGRFDHGWDVERELVLERQKQLGIVPPDQELAPRNDDVRPWDELSGDERTLFTRMQEVFAGFLDHTDVQIGRYLDALAEVGALDGTLVVLLSDNGASQEGGADGTLNEMGYFNGVTYTVEEMLGRIDDLGGPGFDNHYPTGWAMAGNTPLKRYKQNTHGGGIRDPLIVSWPSHLAGEGTGSVRDQYLHVVDLPATILDACGIEAPGQVDGVDQLPWHGRSLLDSFRNGDAPTPRDTQVFEMLGHRAIWIDGWKAVAYHRPGTQVDDDTWELYHVAEDFAELHDLAEHESERLAAMVDRWWALAGEMGLLPVVPTDDRLMLMFQGREGMPRATTQRARFTYYGGTQSLPENATHDVRNTSHRIEVTVDVSGDAAPEGVLFAQGGHSGGYALFVHGDELVYEHNHVGHERFTVAAPTDGLTPGRHLVVFAFDKDEHGSGGHGRLLVDGEEVGTGRIDRTVRIRYAADEGFDVGCDRGTPVSERYQVPFPFTGTVAQVVIDTSEHEPTAEELADQARVALASQ